MGCNDGQCNVELSSLPLLSGCPADDEWFLVGNAVGGKTPSKYARRLWSDIKSCVSGGGGGYVALSATITEQGDTYTSQSLIGATNLAFVIINKQLYTYEDGDFSFNENVGTISFIGITLFVDDKIVIPYNTA